MSSHLSAVYKLSFASVAVLAAFGPATTPAAEAETAEELSWVRVSSCNRAERATGLVDIDGDCLRDNPALGEEVTTCASHFCPAEPGERGARIMHPSDFGPTD